MANICNTYVKIYSSQENLKRIFEELKVALKSDDSWPNTRWVGRLLEHIGKTKEEIESVTTSGWIKYVGLDTGELEIDIDSKWTPVLLPIVLFAENYCGEDYSIFYVADESGCNLHCTNDPDYLDTWCLDGYADGIIDRYDDHVGGYSSSEMKRVLEDLTGETGTNEELAHVLSDMTDGGAFAYSYEYRGVSEW